MSCLELTIARLELSSNFMVPHTFACLVFICGERANTVSEVCSEKFHKIIWKTAVTEYFLSKVLHLQHENF